ncbi:MAG: hypothetical protein ACFFB2_17230 [Promethearchaeota archaeon]
MLYKLLTKEEIRQVEISINQLLGYNAMTEILEEKRLIKIEGRRNEIYLVQQNDLPLFEHFSSNVQENILKLVFARIKLGFFIQEKFLVGIESLSFLNPLTQRKIQLDTESTQKFIFGKDIDISTVSLEKQIKDLEENSIVMISSENNIPLGYAKIISKEENPWLQNLVDIGIFLRSEKSAF